MNDQNLSTDQPVDWREARRAERAEWRARRYSTNRPWIGGLLLIMLGAIALLENYGDVHTDKWWALLLVIPAIVSFGKAWDAYHQAGRLNRLVRGGLFGGVVLLVIMTTLLFEPKWDWNFILPVLLIVAGVGIIINFMLPD
jgi:hypothetical protein